VPTLTCDLRAAIVRADSLAGLRRLLACLGYEPAEADGGRSGQPQLIARSAGLEVRLVRAATLQVGLAPRSLLDTLAAAGPFDPCLLVGVSRGYAVLAFAIRDLDGSGRWLVLDRGAPHDADVETIAALAGRPRELGLQAQERLARVLSRASLSRRFFREFRSHRNAVAAAWRGIGEEAVADRERLALLFLSRLMFLAFLERQGRLDGSTDYLSRLVRERARQGRFYSRVLQPLFFGVLNTPPERRSSAAAALGPLPYLNGGLFEPHALERSHPQLDLHDDDATAPFSLIERYRFDASESSRDDRAGGVHPEMLGRVFESLMAPDQRGRTGTFFTPGRVVDRLVLSALHGYLAGLPGVDARIVSLVLRDSGTGAERTVTPAGRRTAEQQRQRALLAGALRQLRLVDPACGSGAFLLGALERLAALRRRVEAAGSAAAIRREVVERSLYGVDLQHDAALLCSLRLWLSLARRTDAQDDAAEQPLPNLDRHVRQGDALLDPLDLAMRSGGAEGELAGLFAIPAVRRRRRAASALGSRFAAAQGADRARLRERLGRAERRLAAAWVDAALDLVARRLAGGTPAPDLFGDARRSGAQHREAAALERLRAALVELRRFQDEHGALPFFSFPVHFDGAAGFDIVVSNPPWVRAHHWPATVREAARSRYRVCRRGGWPAGEALGGGRAVAARQVDLSFLFLERGLELLRPGGVLSMLVPARLFRSLSAGGARELLLERAVPLRIEDHGLDHRSMFAADAFPATVTARSSLAASPGPHDPVDLPPPVYPPVQVALSHPSRPRLSWRASAHDLPLVPGDNRSPWLLAPPPVVRAIREMQANSRPLGDSLRIRRGAMTGANAVLLLRDVRPRIGGLAWITASGEQSGSGSSRSAAGRRALVEDDVVAPVVRGSGIAPFRYESRDFVVWLRDERGSPRRAPPRMRRYLERHRALLVARHGAGEGERLGVVQRVYPETCQAKVAWRDLAPRLEACILPARARCGLGSERPLVPLNSIYFVAADPARGAVLCALLNSLPARVYARTVAERAKDGTFRFLAWTIATLPLPNGLFRGAAAQELRCVAERATRDGGISTDAADHVDRIVAELYGLEAADLSALRRFDRWLDPVRGRTQPRPRQRS